MYGPWMGTGAELLEFIPMNHLLTSSHTGQLDS